MWVVLLSLAVVAARWGTVTPARHALTLAGAPDTDAVFGAWIAAINADCADTVVGDLGANVVRLSRHPEYYIRTTCAAPPADRRVEIRGHGSDSSVILVDSKSYAGGGGFALLIDDPHVHVHDFAIRGNADAFPHAKGDGNSGEAIRFEGAHGGAGEVDHLTISLFATSAIDVLGVPDVSVHDLHITCPATTAAMGVWVRAIHRQPPPARYNGLVDRNTVSGCSGEGITVTNATHIAVRYNAITCPANACAPTSIGIALYSGNPSNCAIDAVSNNYVFGNTVTANHSISAGIAITGGGPGAGSGHANTIDSNTVTDAVTYAIAVAPASCGGGPYSAFGGNTISRNMLSGAVRPLIVNGGAGDTLQLNHLTGGGGDLRTIVRDLSGTAIIR